MKYINWLIGSLLTLAFLSCMDDKGFEFFRYFYVTE